MAYSVWVLEGGNWWKVEDGVSAEYAEKIVRYYEEQGMESRIDVEEATWITN